MTMWTVWCWWWTISSLGGGGGTSADDIEKLVLQCTAVFRNAVFRG